MIDPNDSGRLCTLANQGNLNAVKDLIEQGVNVDAKFQDMTALWQASMSGALDVVQYLVDKGANVNVVSKSGGSPLWSACNCRHQNVVKFLLDHGADINPSEEPLRKSALCESIKSCFSYTVKELIEHGADVNAHNLRCPSPLFEAVYLVSKIENYKISKDIISILVEHGADINVRSDSDGDTPLMYVSRLGRVVIVKLLLKLGADPNLMDNNGKTALDFALDKNHTEIVALLSDNKVSTLDSNQKDSIPSVKGGLIDVTQFSNFQQALDVLENAYLGMHDEDLLRNIGGALDYIVAQGEKGINALMDSLYKNMNISGSSIEISFGGDQVWNEWLKKREIVLVFGRAKIRSVVPQLILIVNASSRDNQFYKILQPAAVKSLGEIGDKLAIEPLRKCLHNNNINIGSATKVDIGTALEKLEGKPLLDPTLIIAEAGTMNLKANGKKVIQLLSQIDNSMFNRLNAQDKYYMWYMRGMVYKFSGDIVKAINCFQTSLMYINTPDAVAHIELAELTKLKKKILPKYFWGSVLIIIGCCYMLISSVLYLFPLKDIPKIKFEGFMIGIFVGILIISFGIQLFRKAKKLISLKIYNND